MANPGTLKVGAGATGILNIGAKLKNSYQLASLRESENTKK